MRCHPKTSAPAGSAPPEQGQMIPPSRKIMTERTRNSNPVPLGAGNRSFASAAVAQEMYKLQGVNIFTRIRPIEKVALLVAQRHDRVGACQAETCPCSHCTQNEITNCAVIN